MAKLLVVADSYGNIKAAARLIPENSHSPATIEVKESSGEALHEVEMPAELEAEGFRKIVDYYVVTEAGPRLAKRTS